MGKCIYRGIIIALFCCLTMVARAETETFLQWQKLSTGEHNPANPDEFEVNYKIMNVSNQDVSLTLTHLDNYQINDQHQQNCTMPFHLGSGESCTLSLNLTKKQSSDVLELCEENSPAVHAPLCIKLNRKHKILDDKASSTHYLPLKVATQSAKQKENNTEQYATKQESCALELIAGTSTPGTITVTNNGDLPATNIRILEPLQGGVSAEYNNCDRVLPGASCKISILPGNSSQTQTVTIRGFGTLTAHVTITVSSALQISPQPPEALTIYVNGGEGTITITNTSQTKFLLDITPDFNNFNQSGQSVDVIMDNCTAGLPPGQSCTIRVQSNNDQTIPPREYTVSAKTNDSIPVSATALLEIINPPPIIGMPWSGGVLLEINNNYRQGKVAALFEVSDIWPENEVDVNAVAAAVCSKLALSDKAGHIYDDWYFPAAAERNALAKGLKLEKINNSSAALFYQNNKLYLGCMRKFIIN